MPIYISFPSPIKVFTVVVLSSELVATGLQAEFQTFGSSPGIAILWGQSIFQTKFNAG